MVDLANKLCNKYKITIFTIYAKGELEEELNKDIKLESLYNKRYDELTKLQKYTIPLKVLLGKKAIYNKYIRNKFDTEIAFLEGPITRLFSAKNSNTKKIVWIHNDISKVFGNSIKSKIKKLVDKKIYNKYNQLVFVSKDNLDKFEKVYPKNNMKKVVIYNYIDKQKVIEKAEEKTEIEFNENDINFVTVTRLVEQKGIDRLIEVHKKLIDNKLYHKFYVIGDGPEREKLENMIKKEGIGETFILLGKLDNPYPYIKNANYFCLLSKFEGYGMVIEEAKILNKPVIITDTAAREAVKEYENSMILENSEKGIYEGIKNIIEKGFKSKEITIKYNNESILGQVEKII